ncbi:N-acetylmuramoyl-L-alanine amidase [Clostridium sp.]|uniref:N-acetylmuramoyl-L-alanine amidase n=1 Tax=Clostridium sp. TaxID=1506 RepID=UPI0032165BC5
MDYAKVFLDYGHGGSDSGAVGNGVVEKIANLVTGLSCAAELRRHGVTVNEARTIDIFVS